MAEMNQTLSTSQRLQAVFSNVLHKKRWAQERIGWFANINEQALYGIQKCLGEKAVSKSSIGKVRFKKLLNQVTQGKGQITDVCFLS